MTNPASTITNIAEDLRTRFRKHADGVVRPLGRHESTGRVENAAYPDDFRPKHCAGGNSCLHLHPGDTMCSCGRAVLPADEDSRTLLNTGGVGRDASTRHTRFGCGTVAPAVAR